MAIRKPKPVNLSKACAEADDYLARHPEDKAIIEASLALQIGKKAESAKAA